MIVVTDDRGTVDAAEIGVFGGASAHVLPWSANPRRAEGTHMMSSPENPGRFSF